MLKKLWIWCIEAIRETLNLTWTLIGLIIAIPTLSSSARSITLIDGISKHDWLRRRAGIL